MTRATTQVRGRATPTRRTTLTRYPGDVGDQKQVKVYTTATCHWCRVAKTYLSERGIEFTEADIITDLEARKEMLMMTGQNGVPVVLVGKKAMVGWDQEEFERLLTLEPKK